MSFQLHRPPAFPGKGDRHLPQLAKDLKRTILKAQTEFEHDTLELPEPKVEELATVLVEFAEDIHNNVGIWKSLEKYNFQFFSTPLPFILQSYEDMGKEGINKYRVQHLLWVLYSELYPELTLSPTHRDLSLLAATISEFLARRFAKMVRGSAVKSFLAQPNKFGWDVKRKLIWLGTSSYLFRSSFRNYTGYRGEEPGITLTDDFICHGTTAWSGLGPIDILASTLNISRPQRSTLRRWYERHLAYYRVLEIKYNILEVLNVINERPYTVRVQDNATQFKEGTIVLGSLVPWNGEWYWSGQQSIFDNVTDDTLRELKESFLRKVPRIAYRYCEQLAEQAQQSLDRQFHEFLNYHGNDLVIYPSGVSMAADRQREMRLQWESKPQEVSAEIVEKHNLDNPSTSLSFPDELLHNEDGIGVYFNPNEGREIMSGFNHIISGFKKKGIDLNESEEQGIRAFIYSDSVSPQFVRRVVQQYGCESIRSAFLIRVGQEEYHLDYLLRRYKGGYYRNRYPRITLV